MERVVTGICTVIGDRVIIRYMDDLLIPLSRFEA